MRLGFKIDWSHWIALGFILSSLAGWLAPHQAIAVQVQLEDASQLLLQGVVLKPDGTPASGASVAVSANLPNSPNRPPVVATCNNQGEFKLSSQFGFSTIIHATSKDGLHQAELIVPDFLARTTTGSPIQIELKPTDKVEVAIAANNRPVPNCQVFVSRLPGSPTTTNAQGITNVRFPKNCEAEKIIAFHPKLGVGVWVRKKPGEYPPKVSITLLEPKEHKFRVVDQRGDPVSGFLLKPFVRVNGDQWISPTPVAVANLKTGIDGTVIVPWMPGEFGAMDPTTGSTRWQVDGRETLGDTTEARVREKKLFMGQVRFPDGKPREGVLLVATSFGPESTGDHNQTRTDEKGKFRFYLAPDHTYLMGVRDLEWASETRAGKFLRTEGDSIEYSKRGTILDAVPATRIEVKVVDRASKPMAAIWVNFGLKQKGFAPIRHWTRTDPNGVAVFRTLPGNVRIRAAGDNWSETRELKIVDGQPTKVLIEQRLAGKNEE
jgi:hypothetical protein